jgi:spermidine/putrescine transport system ATP-binding protein
LQIGSPQQIYENPASEFVARFIGEANIFQGPVLSRINTITTMSAEGYGSILVDDETYVEKGDTITATIRPEKVRISNERPEASNLNVLKGVVEEPVYSGFQTKYIVRLEGGARLTIFRQHANWSEGIPDIEWKDEVYLSFSARDLVIVERGR